MPISVIIITRNEAPRLRLTLAAIAAARQHTDRGSVECIVVDDGSTDVTPQLLEHTGENEFRVLRNDTPRGRSAARNQGAAAATGSTLLFLDGDCLVNRDFFSVHLKLQHDAPAIARGETWHLRQTRRLLDPSRGIPFDPHDGRPVSNEERVTEEDVLENFASIERRALPGIYPGSIPRRSYEMELQALTENPDCSALWIAVSAQNLAVPRSSFVQFGGFCETLTLNEHRDLCLRLSAHQKLRIVPAHGARSYHLAHRKEWRDPITLLSEWEPVFLARNPRPDARLMSFLWLSLTEPSPLPAELRLHSISELAERAAGDIHPFDEFRKHSPLFNPYAK